MGTIIGLLSIILLVAGIMGLFGIIVLLRDRYLIKKHGKEWLSNHDYGITC